MPVTQSQRQDPTIAGARNHREFDQGFDLIHCPLTNLNCHRCLSCKFVDPRFHAAPQFIADPSQPVEHRHRERYVSDVVRLDMGIRASETEAVPCAGDPQGYLSSTCW